MISVFMNMFVFTTCTDVCTWICTLFKTLYDLLIKLGTLKLMVYYLGTIFSGPGNVVGIKLNKQISAYEN